MDKIFGSKYAKTIGMIAISMMMTVSCVQDNTSRTTDSGDTANISDVKDTKSVNAAPTIRKAIPFVGEFSQITNMGSPNIVFTEGECSIVAEGPEILVNHVKVSVDSGSLIVTLNTENNHDVNMFERSAAGLTLYISAPQLRIVSTCSTGNFTAHGKLKVEDFIVGTLAQGNIEIDTLECSNSFRYEGKSEANARFGYITVDGTAEVISDGTGNFDADMNVNGKLMLNMNGVGNTSVSGKASEVEVLAFNQSTANLTMNLSGNLSVSAYDQSNVTFSGTYKSKQVHKNSSSNVTISGK